MKSQIIASIIFILGLDQLAARVGISAKDPQSQLDIRSSNQCLKKQNQEIEQLKKALETQKSH
jgi:hypothetical protein